MYICVLGVPLCLLYVVLVPVYVYRLLSKPDNLLKVRFVSHTPHRRFVFEPSSLARNPEHMCLSTLFRCIEFKTRLLPLAPPRLRPPAR